MSYIISGLNIQNIYEYDPYQSYEQYDVVDYQLITGASRYPSYTGLGNTGLVFWFNNDLYDDFETDGSENVIRWKNKVDLSDDLTQNTDDVTNRPFIDYDYNYLNLVGKQFLSGSNFALTGKTLFLCFSATQHPKNEPQNLLQFYTYSETVENPSGYLKISGSDYFGGAKFFIDDASANARFPIYDKPNILTILQVEGVSGPLISLRQNGISIINSDTSYTGWKSSSFKIGDNDDYNLGIKYYDLFCFSGIMGEADLNHYEKYLFEKYSYDKGLYWAKSDVPQYESYAPTTYTGKNYWTRDIDELFDLSYSCSVNFTSNLSALNFGDGYRTNISRNINSLNSSFDLVYDGLTDKQAKALIAYFENTPEAKVKSLYEGYTGVDMDLFFPYKSNAELYFLDISHSTPYNNINKVTIKAESPYASSLNYKGMFVELDEVNIRTYSSKLYNFNYNDIVYFDSPDLEDRGYYFYTGASNISRLNSVNNPTGVNSYFTRNFYFKADVDYDFNSQLKVLTVSYPSSTKEFSKNGINYNLLEFNVKFSKRSNSEARAILKFLDDKAGFKIFDYTLPQPYNKTIQVYCPEWNHTYNFYNNNDITAKFIEFRGQVNFETVFNTKVIFTS